MRSPIQCVIFTLFIFSICYGKTMAEDSPCGDWEPYKDEKCLKIFDKVGFQTYEDAEKTCRQKENSSNLVSIHSLEEQMFFSNLLFKTHGVVNDLWIGAKYTSNKFKWTDDSDLVFTNWAEGSPKNKTNHCVQFQSDESSVGKWSDVLCNKKNLVVCEKMQTWSVSRLQKTLLDARKYLTNSLKEEKDERTNSFNNVKKELEDTKKELEDTKKQLNNLQHNHVPIGFIYVQLPNEKSPTEIWPSMTWNDVSSTYAGVFFRVMGGDAASFGQVQLDNVPLLNHVYSSYMMEPTYDSTHDLVNISLPKAGVSKWLYSGGGDGKTRPLRTLQFEMSGGEVRPRNMAIRVWKRTE